MEKTVLILAVIVLILSGCTHTIYRTGYTINKSQYKNCNITIERNIEVSGDMLYLGEIRLGDSGLSTVCSESAAMEILRNEGCALNADVINIVEESFPNFFCSCYRCRAEFFQYSANINKPQSNTTHDQSYDPERVAKHERKNIAGAILGYTLGFALGFALVSLLVY
jgi:hypothetical protein